MGECQWRDVEQEDKCIQHGSHTLGYEINLHVDLCEIQPPHDSDQIDLILRDMDEQIP